MSDLSEIEIIDRMRASLREAIQASDDLASLSRRGPAYNKLREHLALVEGCCRQLAAWREDARWLPIGQLMEQCHQKAGGWLRGYKDATGRRITFALGSKNKLFEMLSANLKAIDALAEQLRTQKTGRVGMILPEVPVLERRQGAPVTVTLPDGMRAKVSSGGIILPASMAP